ncbi:SMP-30/gluconolactonase/LRE family protein [Halomonas sp. HP20-15]|uniref:SMP-30/gluconolactonase/LRE family protein n=1 Tax=Halomonas sp. HP20-15 TaxID=3085901 RepID=UPI002980E4B5|nr:SMP-30/gluconolactonase/LRE family protein [Halomonas sp. HP20-15]MDW5376560.1 SMP-30/gluconolactonase/LRE family protein [Halomonas sp. HP20-15]
MSAPTVAVALDMSLGESPVWDAANECLHWLDINHGLVYSWRPGSGVAPYSVALGEPLGCLALGDTGLVVAARSGIYRLDPASGEKALIVANPEWLDESGNRFNDGRCDPLGRFWVGTIDAAEEAPSANLYRLDGECLTPVRGALAISNGLAFSPDGRFAYHTDSPTRQVWRYAFDAERGTLEAGEPWIDLAHHGLPGVPDGAAVDSQGDYWCALYGGGQVARFDSRGVFLESHALPCPHPTMVAFGGTDRKTLYITTATQHLSDDEKHHQWPSAGSLFAMPAPNPGLVEPRVTR